MEAVTEGRELGKILKQQKIAADMKLQQLFSRAGMSPYIEKYRVQPA